MNPCMDYQCDIPARKAFGIVAPLMTVSLVFMFVTYIILDYGLSYLWGDEPVWQPNPALLASLLFNVVFIVIGPMQTVAKWSKVAVTGSTLILTPFLGKPMRIDLKDCHRGELHVFNMLFSKQEQLILHYKAVVSKRTDAQIYIPLSLIGDTGNFRNILKTQNPKLSF